jgi:hypothetical protein
MIEQGGADPIEPANPIPAPRTPPEDRSDDFAAPLGSMTSACLRLTGGAHRISIRADLHVLGLYRARFGDHMPAVMVLGGVVTIRYPRFSTDERLDRGSDHSADVVLNANVPRDIEVRGGASRLLADRRHGRCQQRRRGRGAGMRPAL